ncbi:hypothetical protein [Streptomyces sp. NPDC048612]|uniref:hypothetical protein n=1 Tax=Streptomyces sp. NPDC048612 TaxID=3365579 RepID=UPI003719DA81
MTKIETPRDEAGRRLCQYCHEREVPESLGTKPRIYCSRNCRQRAYEARRTRQTIDQTVNMALLRERWLRTNEARAKSRDDASTSAAKSRDDAEGAAKSRDFGPSTQAKSRDIPVAPAVPRPTIPTPDMSLPKSQRGSLFPPFKSRPAQPELFEGQADDEG